MQIFTNVNNWKILIFESFFIFNYTNIALGESAKVQNTSNKPPFSSQLSWQSQRTRGAT